MKKFVVLFCLLVVLTFLTGCSGLANQRYALDSKELNDKNSAIVVGEIIDPTMYMGTGIRFINVSSNEVIDYDKASIFAFRATPGRYILDIVGGRSNSFSSKTPFQFTVQAGERVYIGTILKPMTLFLNTNQEALSRLKELKPKITGTQVYQEYSQFLASDPKTLNGEPVEFYVADNSEALKKLAKDKIPNVSIESFVLRLMK